MSSAWTCPSHGDVVPLQPARPGTTEHVLAAARESQVPVWVPWPLPHSWLVTGVRTAGTERTGAQACVVACTGPDPVDPSARGPVDLLLVAEQPGVGLGASLAGLDDVDPGDVLADALEQTGPHTKLSTATAMAPLWHVPAADDRAAYVGEAGGVWLWMVLWPARAGTMLLDRLHLVDVRDPGHVLDLPSGALSPRLA